ncbi:TetR/AcrR family transcriptional regulator [Streptomyces olivaceoviridis]|uniref:TetR/AcrR family transcriptional regulator n=1 Tax=Streptomyces olivaceoviridis TaxID=1921 RepID=UPI00227D7EFA|nr:TetR/AcrR family transcriptional regulator [Streptomyces olivaceoviridis]
MKSDLTHRGPPSARTGRPRNAAATREAVLRSAVEAFTRSGYDGAGVREIAEGAGVSAMMVNRYFGSKENLFAEVVDTSFTPRTVVPDDLTRLSHGIARALVHRTGPGADELSPFLLTLRSVSNPRSAELARQGIERHVERHLAELLGGERARERSALALSVILGVWLMRSIIGDTALLEADLDGLARHLDGMLAGLLTSP